MSYYVFMNKQTFTCDICNGPANVDNDFMDEELLICEKCWPEYAEEKGLCESCGGELAPIMDNVGFTEPEGPSHYETVGYKPCAECSQPEYNGDEDL